MRFGAFAAILPVACAVWGPGLAVAQGWVLDAPLQAAAGENITVTARSDLFTTGDYIDIAPAGVPGPTGYITWTYASQQGSPLSLSTPAEPGAYEVRYVQSGSPAVVRARRPLTLTGFAASLDAPDRVAPGAAFRVGWVAPFDPSHWVTIAHPQDEPGAHAFGYFWLPQDRAPGVLTAPMQPGTYELRLVMNGGNAAYRIAARRPLVVDAGAAPAAPPPTK